jgi:hypothetical protein
MSDDDFSLLTALVLFCAGFILLVMVAGAGALLVISAIVEPTPFDSDPWVGLVCTTGCALASYIAARKLKVKVLSLALLVLAVFFAMPLVGLDLAGAIQAASSTGMCVPVALLMGIIFVVRRLVR